MTTAAKFSLNIKLKKLIKLKTISFFFFFFSCGFIFCEY